MNKEFNIDIKTTGFEYNELMYRISTLARGKRFVLEQEFKLQELVNILNEIRHINKYLKDSTILSEDEDLSCLINEIILRNLNDSYNDCLIMSTTEHKYINNDLYHIGENLYKVRKRESVILSEVDSFTFSILSDFEMMQYDTLDLKNELDIKTYYITHGGCNTTTNGIASNSLKELELVYQKDDIFILKNSSTIFTIKGDILDYYQFSRTDNTIFNLKNLPKYFAD